MGKRGPAPVKLIKVIDTLEDMFGSTKTWSVSEALAHLEANGASANKQLITRARRIVGVRTEAVREKGHTGVRHWVWTTEPRNRS